MSNPPLAMIFVQAYSPKAVSTPTKPDTPNPPREPAFPPLFEQQIHRLIAKPAAINMASSKTSSPRLSYDRSVQRSGTMSTSRPRRRISTKSTSPAISPTWMALTIAHSSFFPPCSSSAMLSTPVYFESTFRKSPARDLCPDARPTWPSMSTPLDVTYYVTTT